MVTILISIDTYVEESLPVKSIRPSRNPVRECEITSTGDDTVRELAASIHQHGLLHAIIVRPLEDGFEIVAGNRRFEACRLLQWKYVPAKVKELSEKDAFEIQLIENIQRMTMNPVEEARAFKKYTQEFGWGGVSEIARIIARSEQYVSNRIQLLRLPKAIIDEISQNRLKVSHALEVINLHESEQKIINDAIISENLTVQDIRKITRHSKSNKRQKGKDEVKGQECEDYYPHIFGNTKLDSSNHSVTQQTKLLQKTQMCLKIMLYRLDSLIHESNEKLNACDHSKVNEILMQFRLKVHSMMDDNIRAIAELNKKVL
ncbi:MAG: ParB/RepB/Spo0J family partition protein [Candidatus Nitrosopolaris sp.]